MTEANEKIRKVLYEPSELERYQMLRKAEWDYASGMATSFEDGEAKGRAEGRLEGNEEVRCQAVQGMKAHGLDNAAIASILNIQEKQVEGYLS